MPVDGWAAPESGAQARFAAAEVFCFLWAGFAAPADARADADAAPGMLRDWRPLFFPEPVETWLDGMIKEMVLFLQITSRLRLAHWVAVWKEL